MPKGDSNDPKGLIYEAYRMEDIGLAECRSIFLDWALSLPLDADTQAAIGALMAQYPQPDHPMTQVLIEGRQTLAAPRRRGGWRGRPRQ